MCSAQLRAATSMLFDHPSKLDNELRDIEIRHPGLFLFPVVHTYCQLPSYADLVQRLMNAVDLGPLESCIEPDTTSFCSVMRCILRDNPHHVALLSGASLIGLWIGVEMVRQGHTELTPKLLGTMLDYIVRIQNTITDKKN